ncbi:MAG: hypothetical protein M1433_02100, partial [Candidatus Parvarchaeota archaeon]|nr:hypothetical protein [Candidatus Parvarchaeota archaeon]
QQAKPAATPIPVVHTQETGPSPIPLLPTPEPLTLPEVEPLKLGKVSAVDIMSGAAESKAFAFVKLSDFKRILEDIKAMEKRVEESQEELESFSKLLKDEEEYLGRYSMVVKELKHTIEEITSSLSKVED